MRIALQDVARIDQLVIQLWPDWVLAAEQACYKLVDPVSVSVLLVLMSWTRRAEKVGSSSGWLWGIASGNNHGHIYRSEKQQTDTFHKDLCQRKLLQMLGVAGDKLWNWLGAFLPDQMSLWRWIVQLVASLYQIYNYTKGAGFRIVVYGVKDCTYFVVPACRRLKLLGLIVAAMSGSCFSRTIYLAKAILKLIRSLMLQHSWGGRATAHSSSIPRFRIIGFFLPDGDERCLPIVASFLIAFRAWHLGLKESGS
jgi:hypothetical protein